VLDLIVVLVLLLVLAGRHPRLTVHVVVLTTEVNTLVPVLPPLAQGPRPGGQLRGDRRVLLHPVGERILAVLDDGLAGLVAVVCVASLAWSDRGVVDEFEEVLAEAGDDGELLAVLTERVELVSERGLELLAGDVGELGFGDEGLGFGTDELLLENDDPWAVRLLVLELGDLVGDLLLACITLDSTLLMSSIGMLTVTAGLHGGFNVADALDSHAVLVVAVDELVLELADFVNEHTELVGHIGNIVVAGLAPNGELLLETYQRQTSSFMLLPIHTATSILSRPTSSMERMTFFSIFTSADSFFARSGPKAPGWTDLRKVWPARDHDQHSFNAIMAPTHLYSPMLALPNRRVPLVEDDGGGGF